MTDDTVAYMGWSLSAQEQIDGFRREVRELKAENAKLREFATETWELLTCNEPVFVWRGLQEKACELEIEVTDG